MKDTKQAARRPFLCGNWKMHRTVAESLELATAVRNAVGPVTHRHDIEVAVAPVFTALHAVGERIVGSQVALAAQNCHWEAKGAFTGEVAVGMLKDVGCRFVILGHSERRQHFGETDEGVNRKAKSVLAGGLVPIICVGELLEERDRGETLARVEIQLRKGLWELTAAQLETVVIAYEPVWAIGTGRVATPEQAQEVHAYIRAELRQRFGEVAEGVRILYGGSVKADNIAGIMAKPDVDGALVGGASLQAEEFVRMITTAAQTRSR